MQVKEAIAYAVYMTTNTFLPNVVNAIVLFYGGTLVLAGHMSAGSLVSFMLYQQSLSSAFQVRFFFWFLSSCSCLTRSIVVSEHRTALCILLKDADGDELPWKFALCTSVDSNTAAAFYCTPCRASMTVHG